MKAALSLNFARCRSMQLYEAFSFPPTNHFQNGALLVSSVVCQYLSQVRRSAYSLKHSGKFVSANRSKMAGGVAFALSTEFPGGWKKSFSPPTTPTAAP